KFVIFRSPGDSLCQLTLGGNNLKIIPFVSSYKNFSLNNVPWLLYKLNTPEKILKLQNLQSGVEISFTRISNYILSKNCNALIIQREVEEQRDRYEIEYIDLVRSTNT